VETAGFYSEFEDVELVVPACVSKGRARSWRFVGIGNGMGGISIRHYCVAGERGVGGIFLTGTLTGLRKT
jgi:hypothetical protein